MKLKRLVAVLLVAVISLSSAFTVNATQDRSSNFYKTFTLTGDCAIDVVRVAEAQLDRNRASMGYTEAWCANFVNDCARVAGLPDSVIPYNYGSSGSCTRLISYMLNNCNAKSVTSIKTGDLVFWQCPACNVYPHVGFVYDSLHSIEGNGAQNGVYSENGHVIKRTLANSNTAVHSCGTRLVKKYVRPDYASVVSAKLDTQGGECEKAFTYLKYGAYIGTLPIPTKAKQTFLGWFSAPDGGTQYTADTMFWGTENVTWYAHWGYDPNSIVAWLDPEGGTCSPTYKSLVYGGYIGELPTPVKDGYIFLGWFSEPEGKGAQYTADTKFWGTTDVTWYAAWKKNSVIAALDAQGGTCDRTYITLKYGEYIGTLPIPTKEKHIFQGWYSEPEGKGAQYTADIKFWGYEDVTWYAYWTVDGNKATLDAQGGTCDKSYIVVKYGDYIGELPAPEKKGCKFLGWYSEPEGKGAQYTADIKFWGYNDVTWYAAWEVTEFYTETWVSQNGDNVTLTVKNNLPSTCKIIAAGYTDDVCTAVKTANCDSESVEIPLTGEFDYIKVMAWENCESLSPICAAETVWILF